MNRYKKLMTNSGLIAIGNFGSKLIVFFLIRFYTAYLTTEMYSVAELITQTSKLIMPLASLGVADAVFRFALPDMFGGKFGFLIPLAICAVIYCGGLFVSGIVKVILKGRNAETPQ